MNTEARRLGDFLSDCLQIGSLKGFRHFELYLRGREELLLRVFREEGSRSPQPTSLGIARAVDRTYLTNKTQRTLALTPPDTPVPPLSPLDSDLAKDTKRTVFLIAAYSRYKCPYVWLRSNRDILLDTPTNTTGPDSDAPIKLETTTNWRLQDIKLSDIISEIIKQASTPAPENPFAVDHTFFDTLPLEESMLLSGAMVDFLQQLCLRQYPYAEKVLEDLRKLQKRHFHDFDEVLATRDRLLMSDGDEGIRTSGSGLSGRTENRGNSSNE